MAIYCIKYGLSQLPSRLINGRTPDYTDQFLNSKSPRNRFTLVNSLGKCNQLFRSVQFTVIYQKLTVSCFWRNGYYDKCQFLLQVFDQYLNFISLEEDLFTVKHHDRDSISYYGKL